MSPVSLTAGGLSRLLDRLDADREAAAREYERLRRTLIKFFAWRGAWAPEECADDTLDRLARRLEQGVVVGEIRTYVRGIARMVMLERQRAPVSLSIDATVEPVVDTPAADADDGLADCLEGCLAALPEESRTLILDYYEGERASKIANRRRLASALGLSENALRSRVQRIRDRLEQCVHGCLSSPEQKR